MPEYQDANPETVPSLTGYGRHSASPLLRVLDQFKAYAVAFAAALGAAAALLAAIQNLPWWVPAVVVGVTVLLVAVHYMFLRPRTVPDPPETAFRLDPWTGSASDRELFDRPDNAHTEILEWVCATPEPLLYITGESGVGKSSLLEAYVIPALREDPRFAVVSTRAFGDPIKQIAAALYEPGALWDRPPVAPDDPERMLSQSAERADRADKQLIVVIDQFEELLRSDERESESGAALLAHHAAQPVSNLTFVLCFRNDWLGTPGERGLPQPHQGENWAFVDAFTPAAATRYLIDNGIGDEGFAQQLVARAREVDDIALGVRPITVNMVGRIATQMPDLARRLAPRRGSGAKLFHAFVSRTLGRGQPREEVLAILRRLITSAGDRRPPVPEAELATDVRATPVAVVKATRDLQRQGLLRVAGDAWEVSHDFVARVLHGVVERARASWLRTSRRYFLPVGTTLWLLTTLTGVWVWHVERVARWKSEFDLSTHIEPNGTIVFNRPSRDALRYLGSGAVPSAASIRLHRLSLDQDFQILANIDTLQTLDLSEIFEVTDDSLAYLAMIEGLQTLNLSEFDGVTDESMAHLAKIEGLRMLDLSYSNITDDGLAHLVRIEGLRTLDLSGTGITDDGLAHLAKIEGLRTLDLSGTGITDDGLAHLARIEGLQTLNLVFMFINDDGLSHLAKIEGLQTLDLRGTFISDDGLAHLAKIEGLRTLAIDLTLTSITDAGWRRLREARPELEIVSK